MVDTVSSASASDEIGGLLDAPPVPALSPAREVPTDTAEPTARPLRLSVTWGDLTEVPADIHVVGHYAGVLPTSAEAALDAAISVTGPHRIIEGYTRRRWLVENLGVVTFFPCPDGAKVQRAAVVAMGRPGTFSERRASQLYQTLVSQLVALTGVGRAAIVLVGSGAGNLSIDQSVAALVTGATDALRDAPPDRRFDEIVLVELDHARARCVHESLVRATKDVPLLAAPERFDEGSGGTLSCASALDLAARSLARRAAKDAGSAAATALTEMLTELGDTTRVQVRHWLDRVVEEDAATATATDRSSNGSPAPTRLSVFRDHDQLRWAAITDKATVPERTIPTDANLVDQLIARLEHPPEAELTRLAEGLSRLVLPLEMQPLVSDEAPIVVEVDRPAAQLQWEVLVDLTSASGDATPLATRTPITRQLRTRYSRLGSSREDASGRRALVIGDPGDPSKHRSLPGARAEAMAVADTLRALDFDVRLFLGAPASTGGSPTTSEPAAPADLIDVLIELTSGRYQLLHYAGHGMFDPADPEKRAGWIFADGMLTSSHIAQLSTPPRLIVANACYSARTSTVAAVADPTEAPADAAARPTALLPSLADEFLNAGTVHYIGAAWKVNDRAAVAFAAAFYRALLDDEHAIGDAVRIARRSLWDKREVFGPDWAAYQHYGDPSDVFPARGGGRPER